MSNHLVHKSNFTLLLNVFKLSYADKKLGLRANLIPASTKKIFLAFTTLTTISNSVEFTSQLSLI